jgi:hypothetical protein
MSTNKEILVKGIKYIGWALPLFFIGPSIIYNSFMNKHTAWHYLVLAMGLIACFFAIYFTFKGLKTILNSMFNN